MQKMRAPRNDPRIAAQLFFLKKTVVKTDFDARFYKKPPPVSN